MTTGAGNDIERATEIARKMVCEWGMSEHGTADLRPAGGGDLPRPRLRPPRRTTPRTRPNQIDAEVKRIVTTAYDRGKKLIQDGRTALEEIARQLLEKESLDGEEIYDIIERVTGKALLRRTSGKPQPPGPTAAAPVTAKPEEGAANAPGSLVPVPV